MIKIEQLKKQYGMHTVLDIESLNIEKGECIGLVGNNGAGKTTLFSLMLDLIPPTAGQVWHKNQPIADSDAWKTWTAAFLDDSFLIGYLRPEEYFYFIADVRGVPRSTVDELLPQYESFFNGEILDRNTYIRDMSKGNQKKVGIIATLIGQPELIIWDEPFANLDPSTQIRLKQIIQSLAASGETTMLISSHDLSHTVDVSSRIIALQKGIVVKDLATSAETLLELEQFFTA